MSRALTIVTDLIPLDQIRVATPCDMDWDEMRGDDKKRFCDACSLHVYNFAAMSHREMTDLVQSTEGRLCARLYMRHDGTVITTDCPVGLAERAYRVAKRGTLFAAASVLMAVSLFVVLLFSVFHRRVPKIIEALPTLIQPSTNDHVMGDMVREPPVLGELQ